MSSPSARRWTSTTSTRPSWPIARLPERRVRADRTLPPDILLLGARQSQEVKCFASGQTERSVFGAVAKTDTNLAALIRDNLDAVGGIETTVLTAFTDGCSGLRRILRDAGVDGPPILDWFHLAMRLQHLTRIAGSLSSDNPERAAAKAVIVEEAERLRWRLWNGKAKDAGISIDRICAVMHHFRDEPGGRRSI